MSKTFKINPDTFEETTKVKRYGNARKKKAILTIKERRRKRKEAEALYEREFDLE